MRFICLPQNTPLTYDYVLVAHKLDDRQSGILRKRADFVDALKTKKLKICVSYDLLRLNDTVCIRPW